MAIGTTAALVGAVIQGGAARSAANAQSRAADAQVDLQRDIYEDQTERFAPFLQGGTDAYNAMLSLMGLADAPMVGGNALDIQEITEQRMIDNPNYNPNAEGGFSPFGGGFNANQQQISSDVTRYRVGDQMFDTRDAAQAYADANRTGGRQWEGFQADPGYQFRLQQGQDAVNASVGARHGLNSGAALQALAEYNQNFASNEYGNFFNRLAGVASSGQNAAGMQAAAGQNFANQASNALANRGNAQAAGAIGAGNAWNNGINNALGAWMYGQNMGTA